MFTCKQVSNALAKQDYAAMPPLKRLGVRLHISLCMVCGKYNRQVMIMQDAARSFRAREDKLLAKPAAAHLTDQEKQAIKDALRRSR